MNYNIPPKLLDYLTQSKVIQDKVNDKILLHIEDAYLRYKDSIEFDEFEFVETVIDSVKKYRKIELFDYFLEHQIQKTTMYQSNFKMIDYRNNASLYYDHRLEDYGNNVKMCVYKYHESKDDKEREKYFNEFNYWYASATALMRFFNFIDNNNSRENISEIESEFQQKYFVYLILPDVKKKE